MFPFVTKAREARIDIYNIREAHSRVEISDRRLNNLATEETALAKDHRIACEMKRVPSALYLIRHAKTALTLTATTKAKRRSMSSLKSIVT